MIPPNEFLSIQSTNTLAKVAQWHKDIDRDNLGFGSVQFWEEVQTKARKLYSIVRETLGRQFFEIKQTSSWHHEREKVITALNENGFIVGNRDIQDIVRICGIVRDDFGFRRSKGSASFMLPPFAYGEHLQNQMLKCRHASLNCYDYDRLNEEVAQLKMLIGEDRFHLLCRTLSRMMSEAHDDEDYPGRHLPFDKVRGRTSWRYQCLRIMDEILCTSRVPINKKVMPSLILTKAHEYGIIESRWGDDKDISEQAVEKNYLILADMINMEHTRGNKVKYDRAVYVPGRDGHLYKQYKDGVRLSAFTFDIALHEADRLRMEMDRVAENYFRDYEEFADKFPLLSMMGRMEEIALDDQHNKNLLFELGDSDMTIVNYYPAQYYEVKKKVEHALALKLPISVKNGRSWEPVMPISIKEQGDRWALMAITPKTKEIRVLSPEMLAQSFADFPELDYDEMVSRVQRQMIGTSPLLKKRLCDVVLTLTPAGVKDIKSKKSVFRDMDFRVMAYKRGSGDKDDVDEIEKENVALKVYLNRDFLSEIYRLDCAGKFITMTPSDVMAGYEEYFEGRHGSKWVPYEERAKTKKSLGRPKSDLNE